MNENVNRVLVVGGEGGGKRGKVREVVLIGGEKGAKRRKRGVGGSI